MTTEQIKAIEAIVSLDWHCWAIAIICFGPIVAFALFPVIFAVGDYQPAESEQPEEFDHLSYGNDYDD